jgi:hypothetical protein
VFIARTIHLPHSAFAHFFQDAVMRDRLADHCRGEILGRRGGQVNEGPEENCVARLSAMTDVRIVGAAEATVTGV